MDVSSGNIEVETAEDLQFQATSHISEKSLLQQRGNKQTNNTSLLSKITDDFLLCHLCFKPFSNPKLLSCLHTFCFACLEKYSAETESRRRFKISFKYIECPLCQTSVDITPGISQLPTDLIRQRLLEMVAIAKNTSLLCDVCINSRDPKSRSAMCRCLECEKLLCRRCKDKHRKLGVTKDHNMVDMDKELEFYCPLHPGELVRFYCVSCQEAICVGCTFSLDHINHKILNFKEAAIESHSALKDFSDKCAAKIAHLSVTLELIRSIENHITKTELSIRETTLDYVQHLRQSQEVLLEELKDFYEPFGEVMNLKHDISKALRDISQVSCFSELITAGKYSESLLLRKEISTKIDNYLNFNPPEVPTNLLRQRLEFECGSVHLGHLEKQKIGDQLDADDAISCHDDDCISLVSASDSVSVSSFFMYSCDTIRSSVCQSLEDMSKDTQTQSKDTVADMRKMLSASTDTINDFKVDSETQTDFSCLLQLQPVFSIFNVINVCSSEPEIQTLSRLHSPQHQLCIVSVELSAYLSELCVIQSFCLDFLVCLSAAVEPFLCLAEVTTVDCVYEQAVLLIDSWGNHINTKHSEVRVISVVFEDEDEMHIHAFKLLFNESTEFCEAVELSDCFSQTEDLDIAVREVSVQVVDLHNNFHLQLNDNQNHFPILTSNFSQFTQTYLLSQFSRSTQINPDCISKMTQTCQRWRLARVDKAVQSSPVQDASRKTHTFFRSGQMLTVSETAPNSNNFNGKKATEKLHELTKTLSLGERPLNTDEFKVKLRNKSLSASASHGSNGNSVDIIEVRPKLSRPVPVQFQQIPDDTKIDSRQSQFKTFCSTLRQKRAKLKKQKITVEKSEDGYFSRLFNSFRDRPGQTDSSGPSPKS